MKLSLDSPSSLLSHLFKACRPTCLLTQTRVGGIFPQSRKARPKRKGRELRFYLLSRSRLRLPPLPLLAASPLTLPLGDPVLLRLRLPQVAARGQLSGLLLGGHRVFFPQFPGGWGQPPYQHAWHGGMGLGVGGQHVQLAPFPPQWAQAQQFVRPAFPPVAHDQGGAAAGSPAVTPSRPADLGQDEPSSSEEDSSDDDATRSFSFGDAVRCLAFFAPDTVVGWTHLRHRLCPLQRNGWFLRRAGRVLTPY